MTGRNLLLVLGLLCSIGVAATRADEITAKPGAVRFDAEDKQGAQARTCSLLMTIMDPSRPEVVNFQLVHVLSPTTLFFGFSLDIGDMRYRDDKPAGLHKVALASGDVNTGAFASEGRMYGGRVSDGRIAKSTMDQETARSLWEGVLSGNFAIHLLRATPGAQPRTYVVSTPPSREALGKYLACSLEIRDIALGQPASPDFYARVRQGGPGFTEPMTVPASSNHPFASVIPPVSEEGPLVGKR